MHLWLGLPSWRWCCGASPASPKSSPTNRISSERSFLWFCWAMVALSGAVFAFARPQWSLGTLVVACSSGRRRVERPGRLDQLSRSRVRRQSLDRHFADLALSAAHGGAGRAAARRASHHGADRGRRHRHRRGHPALARKPAADRPDSTRRHPSLRPQSVPSALDSADRTQSFLHREQHRVSNVCPGRQASAPGRRRSSLACCRDTLWPAPAPRHSDRAIRRAWQTASSSKTLPDRSAARPPAGWPGLSSPHQPAASSVP